MKEIPYIPLLISGGPNIEDNIFAIINDTVVFNHHYWKIVYDITDSYLSLLTLINNYTDIFPPEFRNILKGKVVLPRNNKNQSMNLSDDKDDLFCLVMVIGAQDTYSLKYTLDIPKNNNEPIRLSYCSLFHIREDDKPLNKREKLLDCCLSLTPLQAFLLFANNCVAYFDLYNFTNNSNVAVLTKPPGNLDDLNLDAFNFTSKYLDWMKKQLTLGKITPLQVLKYNGYVTLFYLLDQPIVQDFILEMIKKLQEFRVLPKFDLLLFFTFYSKLTSQKCFQILKRWATATKQLINYEIFSQSDIEEIDNLIRNLN